MSVCRCHAVVADSSGERVLLLPDGDGWRLPGWETPEVDSWQKVRDVNAAAGRLLGCEVTTLRCLRNTPLDDDRVRFYELEPRGSEPAASAGRWFDRAELDAISLGDDEQRAVVAGCLDGVRDAGGPLAVPWTRRGWFDTAVAWIGDELGARGLEALAIEQERTWSISTLIRADTARGSFFFKAVPVVFASEPALTRELSRRHPGLVPEVAALDVDRRWLLLPDFGGTTLEEDGDVTALADALRTYARLQIEWIGRSGDLLRLGCPDRRLDSLERELDRALADTDALLPGRPEGLSPAEIEAVPALRDRLRAACERLRAHELPPTLEHGDLHPGNIVETGAGVLFYDWSDGCLSVPFFSLVPLFEYGELSEAPDERELLRSAYLEPWAELVPGNRLVEAFELSLFVGLFHQAISYYRIVERTEPRARWEWARAFPWLVRKLLERSP